MVGFDYANCAQETVKQMPPRVKLLNCQVEKLLASTPCELMEGRLSFLMSTQLRHPAPHTLFQRNSEHTSLTLEGIFV